MADGHRDGLRVDRRREIGRHLDRAVRRGHLDDVALADPELRRGLGVDLHPRIPHRLRHRVGRFLQPRAARAAAVVEAERRIREQRQARALALELRRADVDPLDLRRDRHRRDVLPHAALRQRLGPAALHGRLPRRLDELLVARPRQRALALFGPQHRPADGQQHVAEGARVADGLHRRLHEPGDALARRVVAPRLQPVRVGQHQVRQRRRLVRQVGRAHHERHLANGLRDLESAGQRERRVHPGCRARGPRSRRPPSPAPAWRPRAYGVILP